MFKGNFLGVFAMALLLVGCQQNGQATDKSDGQVAPASGSETATQDTVESSGKDAGGMSYQDQIDAAKADFVSRFDKPDDQFEVWEAVAVDWASGAIGCPMKEMNYTMALLPGFKIVIKSGETLYQYNARQGAAPFFCPPDRVEEPAATAGNAVM